MSTPSIFSPVSTPAFAIREVAFFVLGITAVIFVVVGGLTAYAIVRYRRRGSGPAVEPPQVYGSTQIELAWTVVPMLIVIVLFLVTARYGSEPSRLAFVSFSLLLPGHPRGR